MRRFRKSRGYSLVELLIVLAIVGLVGGAVFGVYQVSQEIYIRASSLEAAQVGTRAGLDRMANELRLIGSYWVGANGAGNAITTITSSSITFMANVDNVDALSGGNGLEVGVGATASGASVPLSISATATADAFKVYSNTALNDYIYIADGGVREVRQIASIADNTLTVASNLSTPYPVPPDTNLQNVLIRDVKTITYTRNAAATSTCQPLTCLTRRQGGDNADAIVDNVTGLTFTYFRSDGVTQTTDPALVREILIDLTVQSPDGSARRMSTRVKPRSLP